MSTISQVNPVLLKPEKDQGPAKPESELYKRFKSFDVYRKVPQDLTEPTFSGAISKNILHLYKHFFYFQ
jgi:hypothetical protein